MARKTTLSVISNGKKKPNDGLKNPPSSGKYDIELGKRIRLRRVEIDISQSGLADKLGGTFQQVQKYEKGVNRVGASRLEPIAPALAVCGQRFQPAAIAGLCLDEKPNSATPVCVAGKKHRSHRMIPQLAPGRDSAHRGLPFIRIVF